MKKLSNTYLFQKSEPKIKFIDNLKLLNLKETLIPVNDYIDSLTIIKKRFAFGLKNKVIDALTKGDIVFIYPDATLSFKKINPIWLQMAPDNSKVIAVINGALYGKRDKKGVYNIDLRRLYGLAELAFIERSLYLNENMFLMNAGIYKNAAKIYAKLFNKILDKKFSLNLMPSESDKVNFMIGKFFLRYVLEKPDNEIVTNTAYNCCFNGISQAMINAFNEELDPNIFTSLPEFLKGLEDNFAFIKKFNIQALAFNFLSMYGDPSIYAIEYFPALLETAFNGVIYTNHIMHDALLDTVIGKETNMLHMEISRLLS